VAALALVLIAAGLYYSPLRDFFAQQDRHSKELASVQALKAENRAIEEQIAATRGKQWIVREARSQFQLVPGGMQAFVITGLPSDEEAPRPKVVPKKQSLSWGDRLRDLWNALLR
jgi:cell division protein FtsB